MRKAFKFVGLLALLVVVVAGIAFGVVYVRTEAKRSATIKVDVAEFQIPIDEASIAEGKRLVAVKGCADCHGEDLGGRVFIDEPPIGRIAGSNLTKGKGSSISAYGDMDWVRAIRFAVDPAGRPLLAMPAGDFHSMSNEDIGRMVAYLKTLPPVDRERETIKVGPVARVLYALGQMPLLFPFEEVDLNAKPIEKIQAEATVSYGQYLAAGCTGCHGNGFSGGAIPGVPPDWPKASNLTPSGNLAKWTKDDFRKAIMEGLTPDGRNLNPQYMPWKALKALNDVEVDALYMFIKQLPARPAGSR